VSGKLHAEVSYPQEGAPDINRREAGSAPGPVWA